MKILLFGKNGQVGWELQRSLAPLGQLISLHTHSTELCGNLSQPAGIKQTILDVKPDIIVNAAAYTAVDKAEQETQQAQTINAEAPGVMAQAAKQLNCWLIHYSTDYVFDGSGCQPRTETDPTNPINTYGKTKLTGEEKIFDSGCSHLIFRTSWVFGTHGNNFIKTMLKLAQERDHLNIIDDQIGAPTGAELLADITAHAVRTLAHKPDVSGCYHLAPQGQTSWYSYAKFIFEFAQQAGMSIKVKPEAVSPIASDQFPTPAKRPLNSRLDTHKLRNSFGLALPDWQTGVSRTLTEILKK